ncbi:glycosyltransferase [Rhizorhapis sp. SPR117]|uniref:glycosyltransferase n=1 Tax=Rhizorhapis sp. SPR117 TaxID=2912611 RepID=UPI001F302DB1|nr:glycosyltransferase [Rhizorhapis sp. SPR117]
MNLIVNCQKVAFKSALGVPGVLVNLCTALSEKHNLIFVVNRLEDIQNSPLRGVIEHAAHEIILVDAAKKRASAFKREAIELLPHHFQGPDFCDRSILICHDLHIYDIAWKYPNVEVMRETFKQNMTRATAVVTHFPRTYYALERIAGLTLMNLFLTESPLMFDTSEIAESGPHASPYSGQFCELLYPGQLQAHKNHEGLMRGLQRLKERGRTVRILCPGSDFTPDLTAHLKALTRQYGVEQELTFPGYVSDGELMEMYRHCHGVIVPSLAEGGAYVPMEAIAARKPVAVHQIEQARMHVTAMAGKVIWFDAADTEQTANAIEQLADADHKVWFDRNALARERIRQMTWDSVAEKWNILIDWLSGRRERPVLSVGRDGWGIVYQ